MSGTLVAIAIATREGKPMEILGEARAVPGKGLDGDRYFLEAGTFSKKDHHRRAVTLIEAEALEAVSRDYKITVAHGDTRRNLLTRGVALNHLLDREFTVGAVRMRGTQLCEPCGYMEETCGVKGVREALIHRGGLRAEILNDGVLRPGDPITVF